MSFDRVIRYILQEQKEQGVVIKHNIRGYHFTDWIRQFEDNENTYRSRRRKNSTILTHEIMSFAKEDAEHISYTVLEDLARKYIELRGVNGIYIALPHFDTQHYHIHFCVSGIEYRSRKTMRMSKKRFTETKMRIQEYQMEHYPELTKSVVWHGRGDKMYVRDGEYWVQKRGKRSRRGYVREILLKMLSTVLDIQDFRSILDTTELTLYERGGKVYGVIYKGKKYRFKTLGLENKLNILNKNRSISDSMEKRKEIKNRREY